MNHAHRPRTRPSDFELCTRPLIGVVAAAADHRRAVAELDVVLAVGAERHVRIAPPRLDVHLLVLVAGVGTPDQNGPPAILAREEEAIAHRRSVTSLSEPESSRELSASSFSDDERHGVPRRSCRPRSASFAACTRAHSACRCRSSSCRCRSASSWRLRSSSSRRASASRRATSSRRHCASSSTPSARGPYAWPRGVAPQHLRARRSPPCLLRVRRAVPVDPLWVAGQARRARRFGGWWPHSPEVAEGVLQARWCRPSASRTAGWSLSSAARRPCPSSSTRRLAGCRLPARRRRRTRRHPPSCGRPPSVLSARGLAGRRAATAARPRTPADARPAQSAARR